MKSHATNLAALLATILVLLAWIVLGRMFPSDVPTPPRVEAHIAKRAEQVAEYRASSTLIADLGAGPHYLWDAADTLRLHCLKHFPEMFAVVEADSTLGAGDARYRFARNLIRTFQVREDPWPGDYPEWIVDRLEWEFASGGTETSG